MAEASRSILITGASSGIGYACALHLAERGWTVFAGVRRAEDARRVARSTDRGGVVPVLLDVTSRDSLGRAVAHVQGAVAGGGLAGLVNNAGIGGSPGPLELQDLRDFRTTLDVNLVGALATTQAFLPMLRKQRGRVINMGSLQAWQAVPFAGAYASSKWAMVGFTQVLRLELAPWGLFASVIEPGAVKTPIWRKAADPLSAFSPGDDAPGAELYAPYAHRLGAVLERVERRAITADAVARVVERVMHARRPKLRYVVGAEARVVSFASRALPTWLLDRALHAFFHIPRSRPPS